jgi:hypothetical protein
VGNGLFAFYARGKTESGEYVEDRVREFFTAEAQSRGEMQVREFRSSDRLDKVICEI